MVTLRHYDNETSQRHDDTTTQWTEYSAKPVTHMPCMLNSKLILVGSAQLEYLIVWGQYCTHCCPNHVDLLL
jgi:hypothetical protein